MKYRQGVEFSFRTENPNKELAGASVEVLFKIYDGRKEIFFESDDPHEQPLMTGNNEIRIDELLYASLSRNGLIIVPTYKFFQVSYNIDWEIIGYSKMHYTNNYEFETQTSTPIEEIIRKLFPIAIPDSISEDEFNKLVTTNWKIFDLNDNKDIRAIGWLYKEID